MSGILRERCITTDNLAECFRVEALVRLVMPGKCQVSMAECPLMGCLTNA